MSAAFIDRICSATRAENRAAAAQLVALGELFAYRWSRCGGREEWVMDTMATIAGVLSVVGTARLRRARAGLNAHPDGLNQRPPGGWCH
ncbi:Conserved protein of uncharacterised function (13E12 repeat family protein) [Mycobacterium tuberculosis]|nr:Conserved protein of uncharacterised function (13E12 repeat family protein) [Mycobacterium tuberculosis]